MKKFDPVSYYARKSSKYVGLPQAVFLLTLSAEWRKNGAAHICERCGTRCRGIHGVEGKSKIVCYDFMKKT